MDELEIRRRALRAAQVVTLGLAMTGCYSAHIEAPGSTDGAPVVASDAGTDAAGFCNSADDWETYSACCDAVLWDFNWGCSAWGPFVPPGAVV